MRSLVEWALALGIVWLVVWLGRPLVTALAPAPSGTFALVESALPALPTGVPPDAQSVPLLIVDRGPSIRPGMTLREVTGGLFSPLMNGRPLSEPGVLGERVVLPMRSGPSRFWIVLDRTGAGRELEVTAVYVR